MTTTFLLVPIRVDGLFLDKDREAVEAMADFSRLPYLQRHEDGGFFERNTEQPFLSETVANAPLSDTASSWLKPGVHLHWKLPAALSTAYHPINNDGEQNRDEVEFPAAPNRWLVCRWLGGILQKTWLVESDYLWPPEFDLNTLSEGEREGLVSYPYHIERDADGARMLAEHPGEPPFRFIGRRRELGAAWPQVGPPTYLRDVGHHLTAIGYGEPTFAAFYPNCSSVFGLYDNNGMNASSMWYEVFGWYDSAGDDPLQQYTRWLDPATLDARTFIHRYQAWFGRSLSFKLGDEVIAALEQRKVAPDRLKQLRADVAGESFADYTNFLQRISAAIGRDVAQDADALLTAGLDVAHRYRLDQAALDGLAAANLPQELRNTLAGLKDKVFVGEQAFLNAIGADGAPHRDTLLVRGRIHDNVWQQLYVGGLEERFGWSWAADAKPAQIMCYGRVSRPGFTSPAAPRSDLSVAVANSGSEALASFVANWLAGERFSNDEDRHKEKEHIEDHLEALLLDDAFAGQSLDIGAKLAELRHTKGFTAVPGSPLWVVRPARSHDEQSGVDESRESTLPLMIGHQLNTLNAAQRAYDRGRQEVDALRRQAYFDWYRYMQQAYPGDGDAARDYLASRASFDADHDVDVMIDFIKRRSLAELYVVQERTGELLELASNACRVRAFVTLPSHAAGDDDVDPSAAMQVRTSDLRYAEQLWSPAPADNSPANLAQQLAVAWEELRRMVDEHNREPQRATFTQACLQLFKGADLGADVLGALQALVGKVYTRTPGEPLRATFARALTGALKRPPSDTELASEPWELASEPWELTNTPGPQFWRPNDPVVLLAGPAAGVADWREEQRACYDESGRLRCLAFAPANDALSPRLLAESGPALHDLLASGPLRAALDTMSRQLELDSQTAAPLKPFMLEWEVEIAPVRTGSNMPAISRSYDPDFIKQNWQFAETGFDFREERGLTTLISSAASFRGRSVLVAYARDQLADKLENYILRRLRLPTPCPGQADLLSYFDQYQVPPDQQSYTYLVANYPQIEDWIIDTRATVDLAAATRAWAAFSATSLSPTLKDIQRVCGLPDGSHLAEHILSFVNSHLGWGRDTHIFFVTNVGLEPSVADKLVALESLSLFSLKEFDAHINPGAPDTNAAPLIKILRYIDAHAFIKDQRVLYGMPMVNGLPDGGWVARGMLKIANGTSPDVLIGEAGLHPEAAEAIVSARDLSPIKSLYQLNALAGVTQATFARLLAYADFKGKFEDAVTAMDEGLDLIHGLDPKGHIAQGVVRMVRQLSRDELDHKVGLHADGAANIVAVQSQITSLADLDNIAHVRRSAFVSLVHYAYTNKDPATKRYYIDAAEHYSDNTGAEEQSDIDQVHDIREDSELAQSVIYLANHAPLAVLSDEVRLNLNTAQNLVTARTAAQFSSLAEIDRVRGIGPATMASLLYYAVTNPRTGWHSCEDEYGHRWVDPLLTAFDAWHYLLNYRNILTQSLGGFNEAMLMRRTGWQLPVGDPLGFAEYRAFSEISVRKALGALPPSSPLTASDFHPIRSGDMGISALRLVDAFGQIVPVDTSGLITTAQMRTERHLHVALPPRLSQPAQLSVRWLAGDGDQDEWNSHPAITPICGWLAADNLEGQIILYDDLGTLLGSIDLLGRWRPAPGRPGPVRPEDIDNDHLRRLARYLCREGQQERPDGKQTFIEEFAALVESALEQIDPEAAQRDEARALLMSRPLALVRTRISLELQEPYAIQQGHSAFGRELQGQPPSSDGFEHVRFPLRIGEHMRFHDGVVGYWLEDASGEFSQDRFYAPQSAWVEDDKIRVYHGDDEEFTLWLSLADEPLTTSVLMDPRGLLHVSSGLLPTKALTLPPDEYLPALAQMQVDFLTAPLLTARGQVQIALPDEPGWEWGWLADVDGGWERLTAVAVVPRAALEEAFPGHGGEPTGQEIWSRLLATGALEALPGMADQAALRHEKLDAALEALGAPLSERVAQVLDTAARAIGRPAQPGRYAPQELREGWLQLRQKEEAT